MFVCISHKSISICIFYINVWFWFTCKNCSRPFSDDLVSRSLSHTCWNHMFFCSPNHQIQKSASVKLAWHNWWSRICCALDKDLHRHSSLFSFCILCSPFGSCLHVTTLHPPHPPPIVTLPLLFSSSDSLYPFHVICIPHTLISQPLPLLTRICTLIRWASVNKAWSAGCHSDCRSL